MQNDTQTPRTRGHRTAISAAFAIVMLAGLPALTACVAHTGDLPEAPMRVAKANGANVTGADGADGGDAPNIANYRLGAGDRVRLVVYGEPALTGEFGIDGAGQASVPLIGKVNAGGLTASELEKRIAGRLSPEYLKDPSVTVEIVGYRPFYIVGEVKQPGSYPYVNGMTVINAVALAGGYTYRARENVFRIERGNSGDLQALTAKPGTEVLPGDVITVDERFF